MPEISSKYGSIRGEGNGVNVSGPPPWIRKGKFRKQASLSYSEGGVEGRTMESDRVQAEGK